MGAGFLRGNSQLHQKPFARRHCRPIPMGEWGSHRDRNQSVRGKHIHHGRIANGAFTLSWSVRLLNFPCARVLWARGNH